jgi:3-isopropylmalate/(R)-2-methylmalate dehydratase small subunit
METNNDPRRTRMNGTALVLRGNDIDTDRIIPARYMKAVSFAGLGQYAFYDARYNQDGTKKDHPFNDSKYRGASILLVNRNFGCGSSREHAPQALQKAGIQALIGESFAEIFAGNCNAMGIPTVCLKPEDLEALMRMVEAEAGTKVEIDLAAERVAAGGADRGSADRGSAEYPLTMPPAYRHALVSGTWDSTAVLLANLEAIRKTAGNLPYMAGFAAASERKPGSAF